MGKRTPVKAHQTTTPSKSEKHELMPVRHSSGSLQRVFQPIDGKASLPPAADAGLKHEQIAVRAYQLWEAHGRPAGTDRDDWLEAEQRLARRRDDYETDLVLIANQGHCFQLARGDARH